MATHVRKTIALVIDGTEVQCEVTKATVTPTVTTATANALCDDGALTDVGLPTWTLDLEYLVDHVAGSLYRTLVASTGALAAFTYEPDPQTAPGVTWSGQVRLVPGPAGAAAGEWESGAVSLPVQGQPTISDPVAPQVDTELVDAVAPRDDHADGI
jgi:hypothetical protein